MNLFDSATALANGCLFLKLSCCESITHYSYSSTLPRGTRRVGCEFRTVHSAREMDGELQTVKSTRPLAQHGMVKVDFRALPAICGANLALYLTIWSV